jgi:hypothetical protein
MLAVMAVIILVLAVVAAVEQAHQEQIVVAIQQATAVMVCNLATGQPQLELALMTDIMQAVLVVEVKMALTEPLV